MHRGYIKLYRKAAEHPLYHDKPFSKFHAWTDLMLHVNYKEKSIFIRGIEVKICRGQIAWSEITMAHRWGWSRNKVRAYLTWLEKEQQIVQQKNRVTTLITMINYEQYQGEGQEIDTTESTTEGTTESTTNGTTEGTQHKKDKKDKKEKKVNIAKTALPENFSISERVREWARKKSFNRLDEHLESFKNKATMHGYQYIDWDLAFMEAIREDWGKIRSNKKTEGVDNVAKFKIL